MYFRMCVLCTLLAFAAASTAAPPALPDQYGVSSSLANVADQPVLVIVASGRQLRWIGQWEQAIRKELPQLVSLRVADIRDEPRPAEAEVAALLRQRAPPGVSILIDMQNTWATEYALDTNEPCLVLLDDKHNVVTQFRGRPRGALVTEVIAALRPYFPVTAS